MKILKNNCEIVSSKFQIEKLVDLLEDKQEFICLLVKLCGHHSKHGDVYGKCE